MFHSGPTWEIKDEEGWKDWRSENVNVIELNCKVVKKVATPHFYINPPFQVYSPFLAKNFVPLPQVTQFLEVPTPPPFNKEGGGFLLCRVIRKTWYVSVLLIKIPFC